MSDGWESEFAHFKNAINMALDNGEPDNLFYIFRDQLWQARKTGSISIGEWSDLVRFLEIEWWDGRDVPDREGRWDC